MEIYERIKLRRKELGLSAEKVAEELGVSPATIYRYEKKDIKKIFFRVTYKIAYGFNDTAKENFEERYLIVSSTSAPYSFYEDAPTVSYRNHQVGINTKDFSADSTEGQKEVLIIQDNGSYNLVVFKGAEQRITLNLTERTFTATTNNNKEVTINFGTGIIDGMLIDGGEW